MFCSDGASVTGGTLGSTVTTSVSYAYCSSGFASITTTAGAFASAPSAVNGFTAPCLSHSLATGITAGGNATAFACPSGHVLTSVSGYVGQISTIVFAVLGLQFGCAPLPSAAAAAARSYAAASTDQDCPAGSAGQWTAASLADCAAGCSVNPNTAGFSFATTGARGGRIDDTWVVKCSTSISLK